MRIFLLNLLFVGFLGSTNALFAQNSRSNETDNYAKNTEKIETFGSQKTPKIKKSDLPKIRYAKDRNPFLEQRMEEKKANAKDMKKPQYTEKMYFGHKNPPKKRPLGKRKHCKECGLTH